MTGESDAVIELGKSLADALDASDIVGRWMAHHLADLITRSETQPNDHELARETREVVLSCGNTTRAADFDQRRSGTCNRSSPLSLDLSQIRHPGPISAHSLPRSCHRPRTWRAIPFSRRLPTWIESSGAWCGWPSRSPLRRR